VTIPVIGATKPHHLPQAAGAVGLRLDTEEITQLEELYEPRFPISPR
jgi:aryl-alcohol dehydrogenase-like predicted oxidoreductase